MISLYNHAINNLTLVNKADNKRDRNGVPQLQLEKVEHFTGPLDLIDLEKLLYLL